MRPLLAVAILLVGVRGAAPEAKFQEPLPDGVTTSIPGPLHLGLGLGKGDRAPVAAPSTIESAEAAHDQDEQPDAPPPPAPVSTDANADADVADSLEGLCRALMTSAQDYHLPVPFFANLIWQESRLRHDAVSKVGAQGIAQFMPEVAAEEGVGNPFDPQQAIPASARLLHTLREHFGNLGFAAAAYNAGAHRVGEWLDRRRALPAETRNYVVRVTGRTIEAWRKSKVDDSKLTFVRLLPCRRLTAFAELEQSQLKETNTAEEAKSARTELQVPKHASKQAAKVLPTAARKTAPAIITEPSLAEPVVAEHKVAHTTVTHKVAPAIIKESSAAEPAVSGHKVAHATAAGVIARNYHGSVHAVIHHQRPVREKRREA